MHLYGELVDHIFLHCPVAMNLWSMVLGLFRVSWVMPKSVMGLLACWQGWFDHLKIMKDPYQTSSYFSLEP